MKFDGHSENIIKFEAIYFTWMENGILSFEEKLYRKKQFPNTLHL